MKLFITLAATLLITLIMPVVSAESTQQSVPGVCIPIPHGFKEIMNWVACDIDGGYYCYYQSEVINAAEIGKILLCAIEHI